MRKPHARTPQNLRNQRPKEPGAACQVTLAKLPAPAPTGRAPARKPQVLLPPARFPVMCQKATYAFARHHRPDALRTDEKKDNECRREKRSKIFVEKSQAARRYPCCVGFDFRTGRVRRTA